VPAPTAAFATPRLGPSSRRCLAAPRRRASPPGAPRGGEDPRPPLLFPSSVSPHPHGLAVMSAPPLAAGRLLRPPVVLRDPLIGFYFTRSIPWAKPKPNPWPGTRYRISLAKSGRTPPSELPPVLPRRRSSPPPCPDRRIKIQRPRSKLDPSQQI
jgi:hypothetical protein